MNQQSNLRKKSTRNLGEKKEGRADCSIIYGHAGSILIALIITMVILATLGAAILPILVTSEMGQISASQAMRAYYLAEAGGRYILPRLKEITDDTHKFKFSDGDTFFEIKKRSDAEFISTGVINEGSTLESRVDIKYKIRSIFDYGVFSDGNLTIDNNALVDSYSSSGEPTEGENGNVGTNSDNLVDISGKATVNGDRDVLVGIDMSPKDLPDGAESWEDKTPALGIGNMPNNTPFTLGADGEHHEYRTDSIEISNESTLNITGDVVLYVSGTTFFSNESTLNIHSGASLKIYAAGNVDLSNNSMINPGQAPASFVIYGLEGCENITLSNNSDTYGAIYAPKAHIEAANNADVYGSLIGKTVTVNENTHVCYDEDLIELDVDYSDVEQYFAKIRFHGVVVW